MNARIARAADEGGCADGLQRRGLQVLAQGRVADQTRSAGNRGACRKRRERVFLCLDQAGRVRPNWRKWALGGAKKSMGRTVRSLAASGVGRNRHAHSGFNRASRLQLILPVRRYSSRFTGRVSDSPDPSRACAAQPSRVPEARRSSRQTLGGVHNSCSADRSANTHDLSENPCQCEFQPTGG